MKEAVNEDVPVRCAAGQARQRGWGGGGGGCGQRRAVRDAAATVRTRTTAEGVGGLRPVRLRGAVDARQCAWSLEVVPPLLW